MDLNLIVISGRIAVEPEFNTFNSGASLLRLLVTVRTEEPRRRVDVLPVVLWNPGDDVLPDEPCKGAEVWIAGSVQRRFWSVEAGRTSRIEIVAHDVQIRMDGLTIEDSDSDAA